MRGSSLEENQALREIIRGRISERGRIPFSEFMDLCLYHPVHGYYQTGGNRIGKEGDYYTSSSVHPVFGHLLARQLREMGDFLGEETFWVVEAGAGKGNLARDILDHLAQEFPLFFRRLRYGIIERSSRFVEEQKARLAPYRDKVEWLDLQDGQRRCLQGCLLANELIDAFPVHRVVIKDGMLQEICVIERDGSFYEVFGDPSSLEISRYLTDMKVQLEEGQQAEVNLEAMRWYDQVIRVLRRGFLMIIDYGYLAEDLYASNRRFGTLLCYHRHTCSENPYVRIGHQDMTTHVNFTSLMRKGESLGFDVTGFVPQYQFLLSLGFLDEVEKQRERGMSRGESLEQRLTMKHLILPDGGMGDTFKVLIQQKGIGPVALTGLQPL